MSDRCCSCHDALAVIRMWGRVSLCRSCVEKRGAEGRRILVRHDLGEDPQAFTPQVLRSIADGPIMDSNRLYLPAGKVSEEEFRARQASIILERPE